jgi:hypothetical protein
MPASSVTRIVGETHSESHIEWIDDVNPAEWDRALALLGGHPLQSALWGEARREVDGIEDRRWMALRAGIPVWMARFEKRSLPVIGQIGWVPRGPTGNLPAATDRLPTYLIDRLKQSGIIVLITDPWQRADNDIPQTSHRKPRTIWIDIGAGRDSLWRNLDKQWRYGVGRAQRLGVTIETSRSSEDCEHFFKLCADISHVKDFRLPGSLALIKRLIDTQGGGAVEAQLFVARCQDRISAGAFVIRCGSSLHYFWGGTDRAFAKERVGEAVQWAVIEWGVTNNCKIFDLEGIDAEGNPGVYAFKKKMGGTEVVLAGKKYYPLGTRGRLVAWLDARHR